MYLIYLITQKKNIEIRANTEILIAMDDIVIPKEAINDDE